MLNCEGPCFGSISENGQNTLVKDATLSMDLKATISHSDTHRRSRRSAQREGRGPARLERGAAAVARSGAVRAALRAPGARGTLAAAVSTHST